MPAGWGRPACTTVVSLPCRPVALSGRVRAGAHGLCALRRGGVGVLSLPTALHAAGARHTLTSLWRVRDEPARQLIERFYRAYRSGVDAADALWQAKTFLREERSLPTRMWAGWSLRTN